MDVAIIGLGAMGKNLALNAQRSGYDVLGYDLSEEQRDAAADAGIETTDNLEHAADTFDETAVYWVMVPSQFVDDVLDDLQPHLEAGDIIIEGGNSYYQKTEQRVAHAEANDVRYLGTGISGGAKGAREGPCMMPGGHEAAWEHVRPMLEDMAATVDDEPCVTYIGPGGAGHFVKMVHNGIEYAIMEGIAETYHLLKHAGLSYPELQETFREWAESDGLGGFLTEITADILDTYDQETEQPFLETVLDTASQKGTGKWTSQTAMDMGVGVSLTDTAVTERFISAHKQLRKRASHHFHHKTHAYEGDTDELVYKAGQALYTAVTTSYAQGFTMLNNCTTKTCPYDLDLADIARIWRGGCIIRSNLLDPIRDIFQNDPELDSILLSDTFKRPLKDALPGLNKTVRTGQQLHIPVPVLSKTLDYLHSLTHERLPSAAMIQALRDHFGSHGYQRVDKDGTFHTRWDEDKGEEQR